MKNLALLSLFLLVFFSFAVSVSASAAFEDVDAKDWYRQYCDNSAWGKVDSDAKGAFGPNHYVNQCRPEFLSEELKKHIWAMHNQYE